MENREAFRAYLRSGEIRDGAGEATGASGGFMVPPEYLADLAVQLKQYGALFRDFEYVPTQNGRTLAYAVAQPATAGTVVAENPGSPVSANDRVYLGGTLSAWLIASGAHIVSIPLDQDSAFPMDQVILRFAAEAVGRKMSTLSVSGTGSSQPLGLNPACTTQGAFPASGSGGFWNLTAAAKIHNFGDTAGSTATELNQNTLSPTTLLNMISAVDVAYRPGAKFYMNDQQILGLRGQTDTNGLPLLNVSQADPAMCCEGTVWGYQAIVANEVPALTASTVGGPIFGNLTAGMYWRDAGMQVKRLNERYADLAQVGFIGYGRHDFEVRDARAFVTVKPAAT